MHNDSNYMGGRDGAGMKFFTERFRKVEEENFKIMLSLKKK